MIFFSADWSSFRHRDADAAVLAHARAAGRPRAISFPGSPSSRSSFAGGWRACALDGRSGSTSRRRCSRPVLLRTRGSAVLDVDVVASVRVADVAARLQRPARPCTLLPADDAVPVCRGRARARLTWRRGSAHQAIARLLVFAGLAIDGAIAGMPLGVPPGRLALRRTRRAASVRCRSTIGALTIARDVPVDAGSADGRQRLRRLRTAARDVIDWALAQTGPDDPDRAAPRTPVVCGGRRVERYAGVERRSSSRSRSARCVGRDGRRPPVSAGRRAVCARSSRPGPPLDDRAARSGHPAG